MNLEKIIKYQGGWNYQKGRWNTYPNDMMGIDQSYVQLPNGGPKVGLALPTQVFCRDQDSQTCADYEQSIRQQWQSAGCFYSHPFTITGIKFFDIKTKTYRPVTIQSKVFVLNSEAIDKPSYTDPFKPLYPYGVGTFITDENGNEYCFDRHGYFVWSTDYPSYVPQYDFYLSGGFVKDTWNDVNSVHFAPVVAFCPPSRMSARHTYDGFCTRYGVEHARSYTFSSAYWQGWGLGGWSIYHSYNDVDRGVSESGGEVCIGVPPYGVRLYNENEESGFLCPPEYAYMMQAPSNFCSAGYVWYDSAAGVLAPTEDTNVDIDIL